jgi:hypothetical protein
MLLAISVAFNRLLLLLLLLLYLAHIFAIYLFCQISFLISCRILTINQIFSQISCTVSCFIYKNWNRMCGFLRTLVALKVVSSWSLQFINLPFFCTVAKRNSWSPFQQDQISLAVSSNKSSKARSPACHSLPLFCKSRIARCNANPIFYFVLLFFLYFAVVNVSARECGRPSLSR